MDPKARAGAHQHEANAHRPTAEKKSASTAAGVGSLTKSVVLRAEMRRVDSRVGQKGQRTCGLGGAPVGGVRARADDSRESGGWSYRARAVQRRLADRGDDDDHRVGRLAVAALMRPRECALPARSSPSPTACARSAKRAATRSQSLPGETGSLIPARAHESLAPCRPPALFSKLTFVNTRSGSAINASSNWYSLPRKEPCAVQLPSVRCKHEDRQVWVDARADLVPDRVDHAERVAVDVDDQRVECCRQQPERRGGDGCADGTVAVCLQVVSVLCPGRLCARRGRPVMSGPATRR